MVADARHGILLASSHTPTTHLLQSTPDLARRLHPCAQVSGAVAQTPRCAKPHIQGGSHNSQYGPAPGVLGLVRGRGRFTTTLNYYSFLKNRRRRAFGQTHIHTYLPPHMNAYMHTHTHTHTIASAHTHTHTSKEGGRRQWLGEGERP